MAAWPGLGSRFRRRSNLGGHLFLWLTTSPGRSLRCHRPERFYHAFSTQLCRAVWPGRAHHRLGSLFAGLCKVPLPEKEAVREPFVQGVFGGIRNFLSDRVLFIALVVTFLVYAANAIPSNMNLYTKEVVGELA